VPLAVFQKKWALPAHVEPALSSSVKQRTNDQRRTSWLHRLGSNTLTHCFRYNQNCCCNNGGHCSYSSVRCIASRWLVNPVKTGQTARLLSRRVMGTCLESCKTKCLQQHTSSDLARSGVMGLHMWHTCRHACRFVLKLFVICLAIYRC